MGFPSDLAVKNLPAMRRHGFDSWFRKIPSRRAQLTPVFLPGAVFESENESRSVLSDYLVTPRTIAHGVLQARILDWVAFQFPFSRGIFPTQELNQVLPHCRWILYQLSHKGRPRILEWVAHPSPAELASFSRHLVLSKKIHGDIWSTPKGPWLFVLSKTTWHGPNVLM